MVIKHDTAGILILSTAAVVYMPVHTLVFYALTIFGQLHGCEDLDGNLLAHRIPAFSLWYAV